MVGEKPWVKFHIDNVRFSLVPDLEKRVQAGEEVNSAVDGFLTTIVKKYRNHLVELKKEDWVNGKTIQEQMDEADEVMLNSLPKTK